MAEEIITPPVGNVCRSRQGPQERRKVFRLEPPVHIRKEAGERNLNLFVPSKDDEDLIQGSVDLSIGPNATCGKLPAVTHNPSKNVTLQLQAVAPTAVAVCQKCAYYGAQGSSEQR